MEAGWDASGPLRRLLTEAGWTQEQLASATGIGRGTVNGYATGRLTLGEGNAQRIAEALGVHRAELGGPSTHPTSPAIKQAVKEVLMELQFPRLESIAARLTETLAVIHQNQEEILARLDQIGTPLRRRQAR